MKSDLEKQYAQTALMDQENERLRNIAFTKSKLRASARINITRACHMTSDENQVFLAEQD